MEEFGIMDSRSKKGIPVKEGLWTTPDAHDSKSHLLANRCQRCGEFFFPRQQICINCQCEDLEDVKLSRKGKIYSHTVVMQRPPIWYRGSVPYAIGYVELPEGIRLETQFTDCDIEALEIGMDVELVIEKLHRDDEGNDVVTYKFRPIIESSETGSSIQ